MSSILRNILDGKYREKNREKKRNRHQIQLCVSLEWLLIFIDTNEKLGNLQKLCLFVSISIFDGIKFPKKRHNFSILSID